VPLKVRMREGGDSECFEERNKTITGISLYTVKWLLYSAWCTVYYSGFSNKRSMQHAACSG
jgi:hypothetical protein